MNDFNDDFQESDSFFRHDHDDDDDGFFHFGSYDSSDFFAFGHGFWHSLGNDFHQNYLNNTPFHQNYLNNTPSDDNDDYPYNAGFHDFGYDFYHNGDPFFYQNRYGNSHPLIPMTGSWPVLIIKGLLNILIPLFGLYVFLKIVGFL